MNLNLPSNLFYLKENFTAADCGTGKYRLNDDAECIIAPLSGDWGNVFIARMVISIILFIHATARVFGWKIKTGVAWGYFVLTIVGILMGLVEYLYINSNTEDKDDPGDGDDDADAAAAPAATDGTEDFTLKEKDDMGSKTSTILWGIRVVNYILLILTIAAGAASSAGVLMSDN